MNAKNLKTAMQEGRKVYGTLVSTAHPKWPVIIKNIGLDFVLIDTEHESIDRSQLAWMCQAFDALDICPIVRIPFPDSYQATMALDAGAKGIIAPYVETVDQVKMLRGAVKFHPLKGKVLQDVLAGKQDVEETVRYLGRRNEDNLLILNIESTPALEVLDELLNVPDVDCVLIGPHDLSCSLGMPEQYNHPKFEETVGAFCRQARARGVSAGIISGITLWPELQGPIRWAREDGLNVIVHSSDIVSFAEYLNQQFTELWDALKH